ncbi:4'-phosphopantetheinyl transferase family protein [Streptomyces sp. NPDC003247]|uniref:4'-phosphopantetheinyl transferase family protein n=1 Tax=Streptomyces sp. NPDC003247 TaxID=3364677 RepID=UPI00368DCBD0
MTRSRALPRPGEIHLWEGATETDTAGAAPPPGGSVLSADERERLRRLRHPVAAARYAAAHTAVRAVLARYLGTEPGKVALGRAACPQCGDPRHGRPVVLHHELTFSLSRSGPSWLLALSTGHPVGVDLERERPVDLDAMARSALSPAERAGLARADDRRREWLFRCWTRKEAVVKASGAGVGAPLRRVETHPAAAGSVLVPHPVGGGGREWWRVRSLAVGPGRHAAVAVPASAPVGRVLLRRWPSGSAPAPQ